MICLSHERAKNAGVADPERWRVVDVFEGGSNSVLEHVDAFATVRTGVEKVGGPCVERVTVDGVPWGIFPCAEIHFDDICIDGEGDLSFSRKRLCEYSAARKGAGDDPFERWQVGVKLIGDAIEAGLQSEVCATVTEPVGGRGFAMAQKDQRHARKTSGISVSVSCSQAPRASPV